MLMPAITCDANADAGTEKPEEKPVLEDGAELCPPTRVFRRRGSQGELLNVEYLEKHGYFDMPIQVWHVPVHFPMTCLRQCVQQPSLELCRT